MRKTTPYRNLSEHFNDEIIPPQFAKKGSSGSRPRCGMIDLM